MNRHFLKRKPEKRIASDTRKIFYLKLTAMIAGLCVCIPLMIFLFRTPPFELKIDGLENTMLTKHRPLREELRAINLERGFLGQEVAGAGLPWQSTYTEFKAFVESDEYNERIAMENSISAAYSDYLNMQGIYYEMDHLDIEYVQDFLTNKPEYSIYYENGEDFFRKIEAITNKLYMLEESLPLNSLFDQDSYPYYLFYLVSEKQLIYNIRTGKYDNATSNMITLLRFSSIMASSDKMELQYLKMSLDTISEVLEYSAMDYYSRKRLLEAILELEKKFELPQKRYMVNARHGIMKRFEQVRTNGLRLITGDSMLFTGLYDSLREFDLPGMKHVLKTALRDFFYDIDADELLALRCYRLAISDEFIPFHNFEKLELWAPEKYVVSRVFALPELLGTLNYHSNMLAVMKAMELGLRQDVVEFEQLKTPLSPLNGKPYEVKITPDYICVIYGVPEPLLIRRGN